MQVWTIASGYTVVIRSESAGEETAGGGTPKPSLEAFEGGQHDTLHPAGLELVHDS